MGAMHKNFRMSYFQQQNTKERIHWKCIFSWITVSVYFELPQITKRRIELRRKFTSHENQKCKAASKRRTGLEMPVECRHYYQRMYS